MADKELKTIKIRVKEVTAKRVSGGKAQYTVVDKYANMYSTINATVGKAVKAYEDKLIMLTYSVNGKFRNLESFEPVKDQAGESASAAPTSGQGSSNVEGMSFGNARSCAAVITGALVEAGYFGDLAKNPAELEIAKVVDVHTQITAGIESRRSGNTAAAKQEDAKEPEAAASSGDQNAGTGKEENLFDSSDGQPPVVPEEDLFS